MDTCTKADLPRPVLTVAGLQRGFRRLLPVSILIVPFGIAFGVAASKAGLTPAQAIAMSALAFSGAAQFAALDFWPGPIAFASFTLVALAINARHVVMGAALSPWVNRLSPGRRLLSVVLLTDANFADTQPALRQGERDLGILVGGGFIVWLTWVAGTALGTLGGAVIGEPATYGIDVVMACFFAAVVVGMTAGQTDRIGALIPVGAAVVASVGTLTVLPVGWNVIAGALVGGAVAVVRHG
ncbi:AzlC family ABC transporter permease [Salipiger bermudensis]|uniref:AzlC family ABC transporter permease n=1 Tax=Salipiger bermudensis TaxID=344736 RepID=UPI001CD5BD04|nr:AzlC family ABC transporter permease [Salipiger bermudensis]MCA0964781.1 AzlC family ABC transporter permease [Salipiger bermudensis]